MGEIPPYFLKHVKQVIFHRRYIDDGFVLVRSAAAATELVKGLNEASNLNLTFQISSETGIYLDLQCYKGSCWLRARHIDFMVYIKPLSKFLYLHALSNHPSSIFTGIVKGELIRFLRNTSDKHTWMLKIGMLFQMFTQRGYSAAHLRKAFASIKFEDRSRYLLEIPYRQFEPLPFVVAPYHPGTRATWRAVKKWVEATTTSTKVRERWPPSVILRRTTTVGRRVISSQAS